MEYYILNPASLEAEGIIQNVSSVVWNCQFFGKSEFEMSLPATDSNMELCEVRNYIARSSDFDGTSIKNVMIIRKKTLSFNKDSGWKIKISGNGLKYLLNYRLIWEQTNHSGNVEQCIYSVIRDNAIVPDDRSRTIPNLVIGASAGLTHTADLQLFSEKIGDWIESVGRQYGFGWDMYIDSASGRIVFTVNEGADRTSESESPVIFSQAFDNLYSCEYAYDESTFFNSALVGGEGEGTSQRTAQVPGGTYIDRREIYVDGTSISSNGEIITLNTYLDMLANYGKEMLAGYSATKTFSCEINPRGMFKLGSDFFLGDMVEIRAAGVVATARITEIIYSADSSGEKTTLTLEEMEVE